MWQEVRRSGALQLHQSVIAIPDSEPFSHAVARIHAAVDEVGRDRASTPRAEDGAVADVEITASSPAQAQRNHGSRRGQAAPKAATPERDHLRRRALADDVDDAGNAAERPPAWPKVSREQSRAKRVARSRWLLLSAIRGTGRSRRDLRAATRACQRRRRYRHGPAVSREGPRRWPVAGTVGSSVFTGLA